MTATPAPDPAAPDGEPLVPLPKRSRYRRASRWDDPPPAPLRLLLPLYVAAVAGAVAVPATVLTYRTASSASVADVERNRAVITRVEVAQYELCLKINSIARQARLEVEACDKPGPAR